MHTKTCLAALALTFLGSASIPRLAAACGCFAAPNPAVPVVQAGEKIVFAQEGTRVIAHIQIQYEGDAEDFSWLIPVPAIPDDLRPGAEELFAQLEAATDPGFLLFQTGGACTSGVGCGGTDDSSSSAAPGQGPTESPVVIAQSTAGPYDYAYLSAVDRAPMLDWLRTNGYVVPEGGAALLDPYIREGSYFVALKLRSGQTTGDLQPIVLEYEADAPMIPLVLTRLGAVPDMGVRVWILGDARAVPTNYRHVRINEEHIDWVNGAANYAEVVARAVDEAPDGHAFVTELAGPSDFMVGRLDPPGRFGDRGDYEGLRDELTYVRQLRADGFPMDALRPIFEDAFPLSERAVVNGVSPDDYYADIEGSIRAYGHAGTFDPVALTDEIWTRVVLPTREAGALFRRHGYISRLYTAISPEEMTVDPVFAFNPDLPPVDNVRSATLDRQCEPDDVRYPFQMTLQDGRQYSVRTPQAWSTRAASAPYALVVEKMGLEGPPTIEVDNRAALTSQAGLADGGGCTSGGHHRWSALLNLALIFGSVLLMRRRLRR